MRGNPGSIPISNFGIPIVRIEKGRLLGYLKLFRPLDK